MDIFVSRPSPPALIDTRSSTWSAPWSRTICLLDAITCTYVAPGSRDKLQHIYDEVETKGRPGDKDRDGCADEGCQLVGASRVNLAATLLRIKVTSVSARRRSGKR